MKARDARSLTGRELEDLRLRVVKSVVESGLKQIEAAKLFGIAYQTVSNWVRRYKASGWRGMKAKKKGRPRRIKLQPLQAAAVVRKIENRCPDQLLMSFALWTRDAVAQLIETMYGVKLSVATVGRYLHRWGFTPQKPLRRAFEQDPQAVKKWVNEEYPAIQMQAKEEGALIHWGDEMGLRSDHQTGTSWGRRGQTPVIPGTGQRFRLNMISALTNQGHLAFMVFPDGFTSDVFLTFLQRLVRYSPQKVFLIVDGHPVHKSLAVSKWLNEHQAEISMFFLPAYSPELNPDELLNQDVKSNALGRQRPRTRQELLDFTRSYLQETKKRPAIIRNYFLQQDVRYAA